MAYKLYTDGGSRGNPGPGAAGVVLKTTDGTVVTEFGKFLGTCTNNEAEYRALLLGLKAAAKADVVYLECFLDSELIVRQLNHVYKVKNLRLKSFYLEVKALEKEFKHISYMHVTRDKNKEADALVNKVLDFGA